MKAEEKAAALCDRIGLTEEKERYWFIRGYCHGDTDARLELINDTVAALSAATNTIPHETR